MKRITTTALILLSINVSAQLQTDSLIVNTELQAQLNSYLDEVDKAEEMEFASIVCLGLGTALLLADQSSEQPTVFSYAGYTFSAGFFVLQIGAKGRKFEARKIIK